jgi:uncharacterized protein YuzE
VNFVYSTTGDALYIELQPVRRVARTVEVSPSCLVDLDAAGQPLGIELLAPSISYPSIAQVVTRWAFSGQQVSQLLTYPYQSLTSHPWLVSSAAGGLVEVGSREPELRAS